MPGTVTVACKIPNGIIMQAYQMVTAQELQRDGGHRDIKVAEPISLPVKIHGPGRLDRIQRGPVASGYALTYNVDADVWDAWLDANKNSDMVRNKLVVAHAKQNEVSAIARDNETRVTGLEPMDPAGDMRAQKRRLQTRAGAIGELETATKAA